MKRKAALVTKEVAWSNNTPIKYQSFLEYPISNKRTIRLVGEPMSTVESAKDSLVNEYELWKDAIAAFTDIVNKMK